MTFFHFDRLINKYSTCFTVLFPEKEKIVDGRIEQAPPHECEMHGTIVPYASNKIYQSGGYLSAADRQLIMNQPIGEVSDDLRIRHNGKTYRVEQDTDYSDFADVYIYTLKWVNAFEKNDAERY